MPGNGDFMTKPPAGWATRTSCSVPKGPPESQRCRTGPRAVVGVASRFTSPPVRSQPTCRCGLSRYDPSPTPRPLPAASPRRRTVGRRPLPCWPAASFSRAAETWRAPPGSARGRRSCPRARRSRWGESSPCSSALVRAFWPRASCAPTATPAAVPRRRQTRATLHYGPIEFAVVGAIDRAQAAGAEAVEDALTPSDDALLPASGQQFVGLVARQQLVTDETVGGLPRQRVSEWLEILGGPGERIRRQQTGALHFFEELLDRVGRHGSPSGDDGTGPCGESGPCRHSLSQRGPSQRPR